MIKKISLTAEMKNKIKFIRDINLKCSWMVWESIAMDEKPQCNQGDEEPARERSKVDQLINVPSCQHDNH